MAQLTLEENPTQQRDELIQKWLEAKDAAEGVKPVIEAEMEARRDLFAYLFAEPQEGVNSVPLELGYTIKGTYKLDRKIDEAVLQSVVDELRELGVNTETLIGWKPVLKTAVYKSLKLDQILVMDKALIIKPSTPTLEFIEPKKKK